MQEDVVNLPIPGEYSQPRSIPPGSYLPYSRPGDFVGRAAELRMLATALSLPAGGLPGHAILRGRSGLGKTTLAAEFCYRFGHTFHSLHWLQAEQELAPQIAHFEETQASGAAGRLEERVEAALKILGMKRPRLLILDNLEDVHVIQDWLPRLSNLRLLVITQEENISLPGFSAAPHTGEIDLGPLSPIESRELLLRLAPRLRDASDGDINALVYQMEGLPQAIDLCGRCLAANPDLTPQAYLKEMDMAGIILSRAVPKGRTQPIPSIALAFTVSWKKVRVKDVDPLAGRVFQTCGYCAPNIPIPWELLAETLLEQDSTGTYPRAATPADRQRLQQVLGQLYNLGLLTYTQTGPVIHTSLAEFARWIETAVGEASALPPLVEALASLARRTHEATAPQVVRPLRAHMQCAALTAETAGLKQAGGLWNSLGFYAWSTGQPAQAEKFFNHSLALAESTYGSSHSNVAAVVNNLGEALEAQEKLPAARVCYEQALRIWDKASGADHPNTAKAIGNLASIQRKQGDLLGAQAGFEKALVIWSRELGAQHPRVATTVNDLGETLLAMGKLEEAVACFEQALRIDEDIFGGQHLNIASRCANLGRAHEARGDLRQAQIYLERALQIALAAYDPLHPMLQPYIASLESSLIKQGRLQETPASLAQYQRLLRLDNALYATNRAEFGGRAAQLGNRLEVQGSYQAARDCYQQSLQALEEVAGSSQVILILALNNLGKVSYILGNLSEAQEYYARALHLTEIQYGANHPDLAAAVLNLGQALWAQGSLPEAKTQFLRALLMREAVFGSDHPNTASAVNYLGSVLWAQGDLPGAQACFERALYIDKAAFGPKHPNVSRDANNLGDVLYRQGKLDEARACFEGALAIEEAFFGPEHPNIAAIINNLGGVSWKQGDLEGAQAHYERALQIDEITHGPDHLNVARDASNLGNVLKASGDPQGARRLFERALRIRQTCLPPNHPRVQAARRNLDELSKSIIS